MALWTHSIIPSRAGTMAAAWTALLLAAPGAGRAAGPNAAPEAAPDRAFVGALVAAINGGGIEKRVALLHTRSLPCVRADSGSIYRDMFARQAKRHIPPGYRYAITAVKKGEPAPFSDLFQYPVPPTHTLELTFDTGATSSTTLVLLLARERGAWREVVGCAKPGAVAMMRAAREERARNAQRAQALAAGMAPALRDSVLALFRQGRRIEAYQKYAASSGEDLAMSKEVVDIVADRAHLPR